VGGFVGGAGNDGIGGGREKTGALELPAESVRGGGLLDADSLFCILRGPMVGVSEPSAGRKKSSSSGRPCLRPSMVFYLCGGLASGRQGSSDDRRDLFLAAGAG
jgi:hypothetical protein